MELLYILGLPGLDIIFLSIPGLDLSPSLIVNPTPILGLTPNQPAGLLFILVHFHFHYYLLFFYKVRAREKKTQKPLFRFVHQRGVTVSLALNKKKSSIKNPEVFSKKEAVSVYLCQGRRNDAVKMFRNQYDTDVTTWSPAGRLFQVEYAMEAVKQGSAAIGLRSKTHVVLACVNKANSELSSHQKKIFKVDDHIGVAIAGLTADGRVLSRYMRSECINYNYTYESPLPVGRLVVQLADKAQVCCVLKP